MKYSNSLIVLGLWAVLYGPYIVFGGLVRDDLGWLTEPGRFASYIEFQSFVSSSDTMTARPISAVLHGICYWYFGTMTWPYHLLNLVLFLATVLLVYGAIKKICACGIAFLTAIFALAYPSASGTTFSSIMMNSNLAGIFWSIALYLDSIRQTGEYRRWKDFLVTVLLLLSSLSYEVFIPMFAINILIRITQENSAHFRIRQALRQSMPVLVALLFFGIYRGFIEKIIFDNPVSPMDIASPAVLIYRFLRSMALGVKVSFVDSIKISARSLDNLDLLSLPYLLLITASLIGSSLYIFSYIKYDNTVLHAVPIIEKVIAKLKLIDVELVPRIALLSIAIVIYVISHIIFVFSDYIPNSWGFESRTQGAIRFAFGFLIAVGAKFFYNFFKHHQLRRMIILGTVGLFVLFALSIVGQREAWISAARYNSFLLQKMDVAIRTHKLNEQKTFTFVAELPESFPNQVNGEPIFGESWDIGPSLSLLYPRNNIMATVYEPFGTVIRPDQIMIGGYWTAKYPLYFFRFATGNVYLIKTAQDLRSLLSEPGSSS